VTWNLNFGVHSSQKILAKKSQSISTYCTSTIHSQDTVKPVESLRVSYDKSKFPRTHEGEWCVSSVKSGENPSDLMSLGSNASQWYIWPQKRLLHPTELSIECSEQVHWLCSRTKKPVRIPKEDKSQFFWRSRTNDCETKEPIESKISECVTVLRIKLTTRTWELFLGVHSSRETLTKNSNWVFTWLSSSNHTQSTRNLSNTNH
jgi:hypothetical protein